MKMPGLCVKALLAALSSLLAIPSALALLIQVEITRVPDPVFPPGVLKGELKLYTNPPEPIDGPFMIGPLAPGARERVLFDRPRGVIQVPSVSSELLMSFGGSLDVNGVSRPAFAYPPDPVVPDGPPIDPPQVLLGLLEAGLDFSGPIYAFDSPGTQVASYRVTVMPEPTALALAVGALGALILARRPRRSAAR